jgi:hypothetical protein
VTLSPVQKEAWVWGIALVVAVGSFAGFVGHERAIGALNARLHTLDSLRVVQVDSVATAAQGAQDAAKQAEAAKTQALRQVAAGEALRAKQDSTMRASANERIEAERVLRDSLATAANLRSELGRLVVQSRADSGSFQRSASESARTIGALLSVIAADSLALSTEQARSKALQNLTATLQAEVGVLKKSQPSTFGNLTRIVAYAGAGFALGHVLK